MNKIYNILISVILDEIIPATKISILKGNKIFGAAILKKKDLSSVIIGTNNEIINPLYHGEISAINQYFNLNFNKKIKPTECIFLSTHEPCSLCLSAITWSGFDNFYYFFPYNDTKDKFNIPHDLNIHKEVFKIEKGNYNKNNNYWKSYPIIENVNKLSDTEKSNLQIKINKIFKIYNNFSKIYQKQKSNNNIPMN